jgi:hypothetical protein
MFSDADWLICSCVWMFFHCIIVSVSRLTILSLVYCYLTQTFLAHLSWKLKWAILIAFCLSSVFLYVNFYIFDLFSRTTGPILTKLGTNHPWGSWSEGIQFCPNEGDWLSPRGHNSKRVKIQWQFLKSSPQPAGQIQSNLVHIIFGWREFKFFKYRAMSSFKGR